MKLRWEKAPYQTKKAVDCFCDVQSPARCDLPDMKATGRWYIKYTSGRGIGGYVVRWNGIIVERYSLLADAIAFAELHTVGLSPLEVA
jgi:hypothetical protein